MQTAIIRPSPELLIGLTASLLLHGAFMHFRGTHQPAEVRMAAGRTAVELTLRPAMASAPAKPPPLPLPEPPKEIIPAPPAPVAPVVVEKAVIPVPEPLPLKNIPEPRETAPAEPAPQETGASAEQAGSTEQNKGALTDAEPTTRCSPVYPSISQRRGEEGTVILSVTISAAGQPSQVRIAQSSGHKRLDAAAVKAVKRARFTPAQRFGKPTESTLTMPFKFELTQ